MIYVLLLLSILLNKDIVGWSMWDLTLFCLCIFYAMNGSNKFDLEISLLKLVTPISVLSSLPYNCL